MQRQGQNGAHPSDPDWNVGRKTLLGQAGEDQNLPLKSLLRPFSSTFAGNGSGAVKGVNVH
ncbi:MAG: hypothetical protein L6Q65_11920 [Zoogloea sp.]|nr:hypothetical protein [Zoogloea sp.]